MSLPGNSPQKLLIDPTGPGEAQLVWDEYKYRHELVWNAIFRLTAAVVVMAVIPYSTERVVKALGWLVLASPLLGILLVGFGMLRLRRELRLLQVVKDVHRARQRLIHPDLLNREDIDERGSFDLHVWLYLWALFALGVLNLWVLWAKWIPFVEKALS